MPPPYSHNVFSSLPLFYNGKNASSLGNALVVQDVGGGATIWASPISGAVIGWGKLSPGVLILGCAA